MSSTLKQYQQTPLGKFNGEDKASRARMYRLLQKSGIANRSDRMENLERKLDFILQFIMMEDDND